MPFIFAIVGLMLVVIAVRGQSSNAVTLLKSEFTGPNSFIQWFLAIFILGCLGYIKPIRPVADGMILLIIVVMILAPRQASNGKGLFAAFEDALQNTQPANAMTSNSSAQSSTSQVTTPNLSGLQGPSSDSVTQTLLQPYAPSSSNTDGVTNTLLQPYSPSTDTGVGDWEIYVPTTPTQ